MELGELVTAPGVDGGGTEKCALCHEDHKANKEEELPTHTYPRDDDALTAAGRVAIKADPSRAGKYPLDENGGFVSPLEAPRRSGDEIFKTYSSKGRQVRYAEKYQPPPIHGYIAAPHHMIAICCLNGTNKLPGVPKVNPWAKKGGYDANNGGNCIFLPSSASQFYVAYYYWKVRHTGQALQGHLGAHRKAYFETVWDHLERVPRLMRAAGLCAPKDDEEQRRALARRVVEQLHKLESTLFKKLAALKPEEKYRLGAESWIEIPDEGDPFHTPAGVTANLQPYEMLPTWG